MIGPWYMAYLANVKVSAELGFVEKVQNLAARGLRVVEQQPGARASGQPTSPIVGQSRAGWVHGDLVEPVSGDRYQDTAEDKRRAMHQIERRVHCQVHSPCPAVRRWRRAATVYVPSAPTLARAAAAPRRDRARPAMRKVFARRTEDRGIPVPMCPGCDSPFHSSSESTERDLCCVHVAPRARAAHTRHTCKIHARVLTPSRVDILHLVTKTARDD